MTCAINRQRGPSPQLRSLLPDRMREAAQEKSSSCLFSPHHSCIRNPVRNDASRRRLRRQKESNGPSRYNDWKPLFQQRLHMSVRKKTFFSHRKGCQSPFCSQFASPSMENMSSLISKRPFPPCCSWNGLQYRFFPTFDFIPLTCFFRWYLNSLFATFSHLARSKQTKQTTLTQEQALTHHFLLFLQTYAGVDTVFLHWRHEVLAAGEDVMI